MFAHPPGPERHNCIRALAQCWETLLEAMEAEAVGSEVFEEADEAAETEETDEPGKPEVDNSEAMKSEAMKSDAVKSETGKPEAVETKKTEAVEAVKSEVVQSEAARSEAVATEEEPPSVAEKKRKNKKKKDKSEADSLTCNAGIISAEATDDARSIETRVDEQEREVTQSLTDLPEPSGDEEEVDKDFVESEEPNVIPNAEPLKELTFEQFLKLMCQKYPTMPEEGIGDADDLQCRGVDVLALSDTVALEKGLCSKYGLPMG